MIKRWTIHFEVHWGYWPRFSIRRQPQHGERHVDGGVPGTLVRCKECDGQGLLHQPDSFAGLWPEPAQMITNAPPFLRLELDEHSCKYQVGETIHTRSRDYVVEAIGRDAGGKATYMILHRKDDSPHLGPVE